MRDLKPKSKIEFYLERMLQRGFTPAQVLQGTGLHADRLDDPHGRPRPPQYRQIILNMMELTRDPYLGISLGQESWGRNRRASQAEISPGGGSVRITGSMAM